MRKLNFLVCLFCLVLAAPVTAQSFNPSDAGVEGVWSSGYRAKLDGRTQKLSVTLRIFSNVGELELYGDPWMAMSYAKCSYAFDVEKNAIQNIVAVASVGDNCPTDLTMALTRTDLNTLDLSLPAEIIETATLSAALRPQTGGEANFSKTNIEVLGVHTGMTQFDAEARLAELGFEIGKAASSVSKGEGWTQTFNIYRRAGEGVIEDIVGLNFTAQFEDADVAPRVTSISRDWQIPESQNFTEEAIRTALIDKYGPTFRSNLTWKIRSDGQHITTSEQDRAFCDRQTATLQAIPVRLTKIQGSVDPDCASYIQVQMVDDFKTKRVHTMGLIAFDADFIWSSYWQTYAANESARIRSTLSMSGGGDSGASPEL